MSDEETLHDQLRKACHKVNGDYEEDKIGPFTNKCVTEHGTMRVTERRRRFLGDKTRVSISANDAVLSSSSKNIEKIRTSWGRINAKSKETTFELEGGQPQ